MAPRIVWMRGRSIGESFELGATPLTLGRSPENTVTVDSARASRRHAEIRADAGGFILIDLGSANGTLVNGQRIEEPYRLRAGDLFEIGDDLFRFEAPEPAVGATHYAPLRPQPPAAEAPAAAAPPPPLRRPAAAPPRKQRWVLVLILVIAILLIATIGFAVVSTRGGPAGVAPGIPGALLAGDTRQPASATSTGAAAWTVLVYLDGDNDLEDDALADLNEMELAGSSEQVRVVVQLDRARGGARDDTTNGDWDTTRRFLVQRDADRGRIGSTELADLGELNMGDPQTLADFIVWGVQEFPAQRYALVIWDHGSAWAGVAFDETNGGDGLNMLELSAALRTAQVQTGVDRLDLIGFDACLMSQLDVFLAVAPYGRVAAASAELEPDQGWAWDQWLARLQADPSQDATRLAQTIVETYGASYAASGNETVTLSAFDLSRIEEVRDRLGSFSDAMIEYMPSSYQAIAEARSYAVAYSQPRPEEFSAIDLGHFARLTAGRGAPPSVAAPAEALASAIEQSRVAAWSGNLHADGGGMSIFFPQVGALYPEIYGQASPLPQQTSWGAFLRVFHRAGAARVSTLEIGDLRLSSEHIDAGSPLTLQGTVSGGDIAYISFFVGVPSADRTSVRLIDLDFVYPPGTLPGEAVPPWAAGANALGQTWDGTQWALSNGSQTIPALLGPARYGTNLYGVEGTYQAHGGGPPIDAALLFRMEGGQAILQNVYGFPRGQNQEAQPSEISLAPGDSFTVMFRTYAVQNGQLTPGRVPGETLVVGEAPLSAVKIPAPGGAYVAGLLARDIAGRFSYQYREITVASAAPPASAEAATPEAAAPGGLAYTSSELGFTLEHPIAWQMLDTGMSQVYFYDPNDATVFVSVAVYAPGLPADAANGALLDAHLSALRSRDGFGDEPAEAATLAGLAGRSARYRYTDEQGRALSGTATAITSPANGLSYLVVTQTPAEQTEGRAAELAQVVGSMRLV